MEPSLLDAWAAVMWKACWQGSIVVLAVWLICRIMPSMPARCRCWLWRLAILKFMVVLLLPTLVNLPLLPAPPVASPIPEIAVQIAKQQVPASPTDQVGVLPSLGTELPSVPCDPGFSVDHWSRVVLGPTSGCLAGCTDNSASRAALSTTRR